MDSDLGKAVLAATFLLQELMVLHTYCHKQPSRVFRHTAVRNYRWKSPYFSNNCPWKLYLQLDFNCQNLTFSLRIKAANW